MGGTGKKGKKSLSAAALLSVICLTRLLGLARSMFLAGLWGTGAENAAYEAALSLSSFLFDVSFGAVISAVFVPEYTLAFERLGARGADALAAKARSLLPSAMSLPTLLLILFSSPVLRLYTGGDSSFPIGKAALCFSLLLFVNIMTAVSAVYAGMLSYDGTPLPASLAYCASSAVIFLAAVVFSERLTAVILCLVTIVSNALALLITRFVCAKKHVMRAKASCKQKSSDTFPESVKETDKGGIFGIPAAVSPGKILCVILFSAYVPACCSFVAAHAARAAGGAGLVANGYAQKIVVLTSGVLAYTFHALFYPKISKEALHGKSATASKGIKFLFAATLCISVFLFLFSGKIVGILFMRGNFDEEALRMTSEALRAYSLLPMLLTLLSVFTDALYASHRHRELAVFSVISAAVLFLGMTLIPDSAGLSKAPAAFSVSCGLYCIMCLLLLSKRNVKQRAKLLLFLTDKNIGGAGRQLLNYLENADRGKFDITAVLPLESQLGDSVRRLGYRVVYLHGIDRSFSLSGFFYCLRLIFHEKPDIVHTNACLSARLASLLLAVPVRVYTRHCVFPVSGVYSLRPVRAAVGAISGVLSGAVIAVADEAGKNLISMGVSARRIHVIPNGVRAVTVTEEQRRSISGRYELNGALTAVICGRLEKDKGVEYLIKAVAECAGAGTDVKALIVGTGSQYGALQELSSELEVTDRVFFCGFVKDVSPYLSAADVYVNCSVGTEATSLAIAEAMSAGLPVIASDYGGNPGMVENGRNGIITPQRDVKALAQALTSLCDPEKRKIMGEKSLEIYRERFCAEKMARNSEKLYMELITRKGIMLS